MYRLSLIISEIYNKYLPLADKSRIQLDLDFPDTTQNVSDPDQLKQELDQKLDSLIKNSKGNHIAINVDSNAITLTDDATTLSPTLCKLLSNQRVTVKSRVGFGTTITFALSKPSQPAVSKTVALQPTTSQPAASQSTASKVTASQPAAPKKVASKTSSIASKTKSAALKASAK